MNPGEEAVRTMFTTHDEQHLIVVRRPRCAARGLTVFDHYLTAP